MSSSFEQMIQDMRSCLEDIRQFLSSYGEEDWLLTFEELLKEIPSNSKLDLHSERLLRFLSKISSLFGGMGSFNDLALCMENGHNVLKEEEKQVNSILGQLRVRLYDSFIALETASKSRNVR